MLAAGAAGMVCGSCLRDNRLAATLREQGRDVTLIPLYTPIRTDEVDVSESTVYFGGVNVYLQQKLSFFRRLPRFFDRLLSADWLLRRLRSGAMHPEDLGGLTVSVLRGEHGRQRKEVERLADALAERAYELVVVPNLMFAGVARYLRDALRTPVVCTLSGEDIFLDQLPQPYRADAMRLISDAGERIDAFIAVTRYYADHSVRHFALPRERVHVVPMGVRIDDFRAALERPGAFTIGYMARIGPEKGLHQLVDAFIELHRQERTCRLRVAGWLGAADRPYLSELQSRVARAGLSHQVDWLGEVTRAEKAQLIGSLHVLCVPTVYAEAKGLYVLEALAGGAPVVAPRHGSFPELVQESGGGLLFEPGDAAGLVAALRRLMDDEPMRLVLARSGRSAVAQRFTDARMAEAAWSVLEGVYARRGG